MSLVVKTATLPVADGGELWLAVAKGEGPADWRDQVPASIAAQTSDLLPSPARDVLLSVTLQDEATILFTASARKP